jgi:hypothetical protein
LLQVVAAADKVLTVMKQDSLAEAEVAQAEFYLLQALPLALEFNTQLQSVEAAEMPHQVMVLFSVA